MLKLLKRVSLSLFLFISVLFDTNFTGKNVGFSGIQICKVGVQGKPRWPLDHGTKCSNYCSTCKNQTTCKCYLIKMTHLIFIINKPNTLKCTLKYVPLAKAFEWLCWPKFWLCVCWRTFLASKKTLHFFYLVPVWPDVGIQSSPKGSHSNFYLKNGVFQNSPKSYQIFGLLL